MFFYIDIRKFVKLGVKPDNISTSIFINCFVYSIIQIYIIISSIVFYIIVYIVVMSFGFKVLKLIFIIPLIYGLIIKFFMIIKYVSRRW